MSEGPLDVAGIDRQLAAALPAGSLYAVGGRVRDEVRARLEGLAIEAKDLDYVAVGLELPELVERLQALGPADVVGASFAVVKATLGGTTVDVALPRRERSTGAGHREFAVEAGPAVTLEEDLGRRDFRMNMLARALPGGALVDPYGGEADIRARRIDLLSPSAFEEDPLRMLRAAQFAARFGYAVSPATIAAMRAAAPLVTTVSPERTRDELMKLIALAPKPSVGFAVMREGGILPYALPELSEGIGVEQNEWHAFDVYGHSLATLDAMPQGDEVARLAALFHDVGKPRTKDGPHFYGHDLVGERMSRELLERLRVPNEVSETVASLVRNHMYAADPSLPDRTLRRFIRRVGPENLARQFALRAADIAGSGLPKRGQENERFQERVWAVLSEQPPLSVKDLTIGGADVIAVLQREGVLPPGSRGGPEVGRVLQRVLERVLDEPDLGRERQLEIAAAEAKMFHGEPSATAQNGGE